MLAASTPVASALPQPSVSTANSGCPNEPTEDWDAIHSASSTTPAYHRIASQHSSPLPSHSATLWCSSSLAERTSTTLATNHHSSSPSSSDQLASSSSHSQEAASSPLCPEKFNIPLPPNEALQVYRLPPLLPVSPQPSLDIHNPSPSFPSPVPPSEQ